jgi:hypothetical protein
VTKILLNDMCNSKQGMVSWNTNSIGFLIQRTILAVISFASILIMVTELDYGCLRNGREELYQRILHIFVPWFILCGLIFLKVSCFRNQNLVLWFSFIAFIIT